MTAALLIVFWWAVLIYVWATWPKKKDNRPYDWQAEHVFAWWEEL